jgi:dihydrofolate reductase
VWRVRYCIAMSLDGYIAGPADESDWILMDPSFDFASLWASFDTVVMGGAGV